MSPYDLFERFRYHPLDEAVIDGGNSFTYRDLHNAKDEHRHHIDNTSLCPGAVVAFVAKPSFHSIAFLLALWERGAIIVPRLQSTNNLLSLVTADPEWVINVQADMSYSIKTTGSLNLTNHFYGKLRAYGHPGLVVFTTGTTGEQKGIVHDMERVLGKFARPRRSYRMISFLQHDHFGGINTLLYALTSGSCLVMPKDRTPETILSAVEKHKVTLLPTTPIFLKYMIMSRHYTQFDLSSLELITYGSEMMEEDVLKKLHELFPNVELRQTYGLSELGVLHAKSKNSDSLWIKVGGPGFETKVDGGTLRVRSESSMLGYLDGTDPFDADGWYDTGDLVDVDGEYVRFRGRRVNGL